MLELRIATSNVENLFGRAKVFVDAPDLGFADGILGMIDELRGLLREKDDTDARKTLPHPHLDVVRGATLRATIELPPSGSECLRQVLTTALGDRYRVR